MSWGGHRKGAGRKRGYESPHRKTGHKTKVVRVPEHWDPIDFFDGLEMLDSLINSCDEEIKASADKSKNGEPSNRYWKLEECLKQMRQVFPRSYFEHRHRRKHKADVAASAP